MLVTGPMPDASHSRAGLLPFCAVWDRLGDPDQVALAVIEERAALAAALARVVVGRGDHVATDIQASHLEGARNSHPGLAGQPRSPRGSRPRMPSGSIPPTAPPPS